MKLQIWVAIGFALVGYGIWHYTPDVVKAISFILACGGLGFFIAKRNAKDVVDKITKP